MNIAQALQNFAKHDTVSSLGVSALGMLSNARVLTQIDDLDEAGILNREDTKRARDYVYDLPTRDALIIAARNNPAVLSELIEQWLEMTRNLER